MLREVAKGLGFSAFGDASPGPGRPAGMSYSPGVASGRVRLVASKGKAREATYREIYYSNPFVYAATNYIARGIARLPLHVFQLNALGEKERIRADVPGAKSRFARFDEILNQPGSRIARGAFYAGTLRSRLILGNGLWEIKRELGGGLPSGLVRVPMSQVMHIEEDSWGSVQYYVVRDPDRRRRTIFPDDVIHFGLGGELEGACGVSLLESCSSTLALHEAILRHLLGYMENSAQPSGHVQVERASRERMKEIRELLTELHASPENAGRIMVTTGKWTPTGDSPDHSKIIELLKESRLEVATAFQTPPTQLGILDDAVRANVKEMREQYGRETIGPWTSDMEDEIMSQLIAPYDPTLFCAFQLAEQLKPDLEARALVYQRLMHIFSIDEVRGFEDKAPLKIAGVTDVPWVASGAMPLTTAASARVQQKVSGPAASDFELEEQLEALLEIDADAPDAKELALALVNQINAI